MKAAWSAALAVILVLCLAACLSSEDWGRAPAEQNYNLLVRGFRHGQLNLAKEVPAGLLQLPDPYDPAKNASYRFGSAHLHDLSLFQGKLYLYFGPTPAWLLLPWSILTGHDLSDRATVLIFAAIGVLATCGALVTLRRRFFPEVRSGPLAALVLVVGLASGLPMLVQHPGMHEIPIACAYAGVALSLLCLLQSDLCAPLEDANMHSLAGAPATLNSPIGDLPAAAARREARAGTVSAPKPPLTRATAQDPVALGLSSGDLTPLHPSKRRTAWYLVGAGLCYGLAVAARPSLLPGAILFLFTNPGWSRTGLRRLAAVAVPLGVCLIGLLVYNQARFHSPVEFGQKYQLAEDRQDTAQHFSVSYLPYNLRAYFANPANSTLPAPPDGHAAPEDPFGILPNLPFVLLALLAPLALPLRRFTKALALLFAASFAPLALFYGTCSRYEIDFLPLLVLLAAIGVLALESGAGRYRPGARIAWLTLSALSILLMGSLTLRRHAEELFNLGTVADQSGHSADAIPYFESALRADPRYVQAEQNLATAYVHLNRLPDAITHYQAALRLTPDSALSHFNLGIILYQAHHDADAANEFRAALRIDPTFESAQANLNAVEGQSR